MTEPFAWLERSERHYRRSLTVSLVLLAFQVACAVAMALLGRWWAFIFIVAVTALTQGLGHRNRVQWRAGLDEAQLLRAEWRFHRGR